MPRSTKALQNGTCSTSCSCADLKNVGVRILMGERFGNLDGIIKYSIKTLDVDELKMINTFSNM